MKYKHKSGHILLIIITAVVFISIIVLSATAQTGTSVSFIQQLKMGNLAVADYNSTDGLSLYSQNNVRNESRTPECTVFTYEGAASGYPRISNRDGIFLSGTYDNSTIVFFVKETGAEEKSISIKTKNVEETVYFADIYTGKTYPSSVSLAVLNEDELCWRNIITNSSYTDVITDIDYSSCPFDEEKNAYMIALRVDNGMTCFESMQISGLEIYTIRDCRKPLFYKDGVLMQGAPDNSYEQADSSVNFSIDLIRDVTACETAENDFKDTYNLLLDFLKRLSEFIIRISEHILSYFR